MYGKEATISLIKSLIDYESNTAWGRALRYAVSKIEKEIDNDAEVVDKLIDDLYAGGSPRCDYSLNELGTFVRAHINNLTSGHADANARHT